MINIMLNIFFYIFFTHFVSSVDRIWLIRHCDKPNNSVSPCCSQLGYERSDNWFYYLDRYLKKNNNIIIYSSNFNEKKICIPYVNKHHEANRNCQKSQRMFLTAYSIQNKLTKNDYHVKKYINSNYCIGDKIKLLENIINNKSIKDAIVVWEHKEIIEIIRNFNISIKKWKNKFKDEYDLIFLIDNINKQLYVDCFNFVTNGTKCKKDLEIWFQDFNKIPMYYENNLYLTSIELGYTNKIYKLLNYLFFTFCLYIVFFATYIICFRIYYRKLRQGYTQIY